MGWERKIPFGYRMEQTKLVCEESEAETVRRIFERYLGGESLAQIARSLSGQDVRYHAHSPVWNKNMIKRIIEDGRYLGNEDYPKIVDRDTFLSVRLMKADKVQPVSPCPEAIKPLRDRMSCAVCGARMRRHPSSRRKIRWICANNDCRHTAIIQDEDLIEGVKRCLEKLTLSPQLSEGSAPESMPKGMNILRLENELTAAFNRGTESVAYMKALIFALAAERYSALPDRTAEHEMDTLQVQFNEHEIDMEIFINKAVRRVLLRRGAGVAVELINGVTITNGEEEAK